MTKHSPGPWLSRAGSREVLAEKRNPKMPGMEYWHAIATIEPTKCAGDDPEMEANKALISAAPDLLEALESIENDDGHIPAPIWEKICAALNKAKGVKP